MGNKWSATPPSFTSDIEEEEPPDKPPDDDESTLTVTLVDVKNFSPSLFLDSILGDGCVQLRVNNTFNSQSYCKTMKYDVTTQPNNEWNLQKKMFVFTSNDPDGDIKVSLVRTNSNQPPELTSEHNKRDTIATITIPVTLHELKSKKHIDRWIEVEDFYLNNNAQVLISLDYFYHPSRIFRTGQEINDKYEIESTLGTGQFVVKKACNKHSMKDYAVKYLSKQVKGQVIPRCSIDREIDLLQSLSHPNIVELIESVEDSETVYLVMELIKGSDLYDITETLGSVRPGVAGAILRQLISAVFYLHSHGIAHHDIKPENIVVDYLSNTVKLTDFGSAKKLKEVSGVCGTIPYMAPEILQNLKGKQTPCELSVDIWSIGIVAFVLLSGRHPFEKHPHKSVGGIRKSADNSNIIKRIISGKFDFPKSGWNKIPKHCKDFIKKCLVVDPKKRATISELEKHPWIVASEVESPANSFTLEEFERLECEKIERRNSRSSSMGSLLELFGGGKNNNNFIILRS